MEKKVALEIKLRKISKTQKYSKVRRRLDEILCLESAGKEKSN